MMSMEKNTVIQQRNDKRIFDPRCSKTYTFTHSQTQRSEICQGIHILNKEGVHPIYKVSFDDVSYYAAQQLVEDVHILNFRDIGGYFTEDNRQIKHRCFYRSAPIQFQDESGKEAFKSLNINTILDLRSNDEVTTSPDDVIDGVNYLHLCAINDEEFDGSFDMSELLESGSVDSLTAYMTKIYQLIPFKNKAYQKMFDLMLEGNVPFVFHCSAGKDRTGFASYLIMRTLGVSDEIAAYDYLMSNTYLYENNQKLIQHFQKEGSEALFCVKMNYLNESIHAIFDKYQTFENYLECEYGLDDKKRNQLKEMYLYEGNYD